MRIRNVIVITICAATLTVASGLSVLRSAGKPTRPPQSPKKIVTAVFGGGCFWGLQAAFDALPGVVSSRVGYTGGTTSDPTYSEVITGATGHAEAVEVTFDPDEISYGRLVQFHLEHGKPIKGPVDSSYAKRHYRKSVFVRGADQRTEAERILNEFNQTVSRSHVLIESATAFWEAEAEHQNYLAKCVH